MTPHPLIVRGFRGLARRLLWPTRLRVVRALTSRTLADTAPPGAELMIVRAGASEALLLQVRVAMQAAGEDPNWVETRLSEGDLLIGWLIQGRVASFGWMRRRQRQVGSLWLREAPGRAFGYNFATLAQFRRQGLYRHLLVAAMALLAAEGITEVFAEVNVHNLASAEALQAAGFEDIGEIRYWTLASCWTTLARKTTFDVPGLAPW